MAIRMSEPMQGLVDDVDQEIKGLILRHGGSGRLAQVVLSANQWATTTGDKNQQLRHEIDRLRSEVASFRADAERLEWIEKRLFVRKWNGVIDGGSRIQWSIAGDFRHTTQRMIGNTFRAAVDEARGTV